MANYDEIKRQLRVAEDLVTEGEVEEADQLIRNIDGLTPADLAANLSRRAVKKLRDHARENR